MRKKKSKVFFLVLIMLLALALSPSTVFAGTHGGDVSIQFENE